MQGAGSGVDKIRIPVPEKYKQQQEIFMHTAIELFKEAESLPVDDRVLLTNSLLKTLHSPDRSIDKDWFAIAQKRLLEIKSGRVKPVSGEELFRKIRKRFEK